MRRLERGDSYRLPLLAQLVRFFRPRAGFTLTTTSEAPAGAGIGGSSAMAVAICAALDRFTGAGLDRQDWIHISRDVEAIVIRVPTGTQDHYPPAFGGASAIHLEPGGERREELGCDLAELERRLVLCYTGKPRQSAINNWEVFKRHIDGDRSVWRNLQQIAAVAVEVRAALTRNDWSEVGRLMREEWAFRRRNLATISTPVIDRIIAGGRKQGALRGQGVRRGRRRVRGAADRAGRTRARRSGCRGCRRNGVAAADRPARRARACELDAGLKI